MTLPVTGTIEAGTRTPSRLQPRQAARVQTGAPLPTLADAVLPLRWTDGGTVEGAGAARRAARVLMCGVPVTTSSPATSRCAPARSSAPPRWGCWRRSAGNGCWCTRVRGCRCMAVGGELVDISRTPGNGQVYDVNSYALAAAARDAGAEVNRVGIVSNDPKELGEIVEGHINRAEIVVIAGGVGGAPAEAVRSVLSELGEMEVVAGRDASRIGPGFRAAGPRRCSDLPAAGQSGQRAGGLRGDGPAVDPAVAGEAPADAPDRAGPHAVADHVGGRAQGLTCAAS